jgi:hypothetical protein
MYLTRVNTVQQNRESTECHICCEFPIILILKNFLGGKKKYSSI